MKKTLGAILVRAVASALALGMLTACSGAGDSDQGGQGGGAPTFESEKRADDPNAAMIIGEDVPLPDNWPTALPIPNGGSVNSVGVAENGSANALWVFSTPVPIVAGEYESLLLQAGYSEVPESDIELEGIAGADWTGNGFEVSVVTSDNGDGTTSLSVNAAVVTD